MNQPMGYTKGPPWPQIDPKKLAEIMAKLGTLFRETTASQQRAIEQLSQSALATMRAQMVKEAQEHLAKIMAHNAAVWAESKDPVYLISTLPVAIGWAWHPAAAHGARPDPAAKETIVSRLKPQHTTAAVGRLATLTLLRRQVDCMAAILRRFALPMIEQQGSHADHAIDALQQYGRGFRHYVIDSGFVQPLSLFAVRYQEIALRSRQANSSLFPADGAILEALGNADARGLGYTVNAAINHLYTPEEKQRLIGLGQALTQDPTPIWALVTAERSRAVQVCDVVRCVFPCPDLAEITPPADAAAANHGLAAKLAYEILTGRDAGPAEFAVLADALEEGGCADERILGHLRAKADHAPECWAVQAVTDCHAIPEDAFRPHERDWLVRLADPNVLASKDGRKLSVGPHPMVPFRHPYKSGGSDFS